jgi:hypothetical protein
MWSGTDAVDEPRQEPIQIHARPRHDVDAVDSRAPQEYVSVREAASRLGTSESDIRRKIKAGALVAESLPRPGGTILRVRVDAPEPAPDTRQPTPDAPTELAIAAPEPGGPTPEPRQDAGEAVTLALVAELAAHREQAQETAAMVADLREALGHARSDASAASTRAAEMAAQLVASDELLLANAETIAHQAQRLSEQSDDLLAAVRAGAVLSAELTSTRLMADELGWRLQAAEREQSRRTWWQRVTESLGW